MTRDAREVAHQILGVICRAAAHSTTCDRVTSEILADRAATVAAHSDAPKRTSSMRVVYIAGRFRGANAWEVAENVRAAERRGFEVAQLGAMPLIPHANTAHFDGTLTPGFWLEGTMELMRRCDAVLTVDNWRESEGAVGEIGEAVVVLDKPVFNTVESLREWLRAEDSL